MNAATLSKEYANGNRNFQGFQLSGVNLGWSTLVDANFCNADLSGANLSGASLKFANLSGNTNLTFADLSRADLTGADLRGANLEGASLEGTLLSNIVYDEKTRFPKGFSLDATKAINVDSKEQDLFKQKIHFTENLTLPKDFNYRQKTSLDEYKIAKSPKNKKLDLQKPNRPSKAENTQELQKSNKDRHATKSALFWLKVLISTFTTFALGGFLLSLTVAFYSQQKIIKQEQEKVKKAEIQNDQLTKVKEKIEREHIEVKRDLESERRQFKSEVQQVLMAEDKILRKAFDSQEIFWVCD
jgi:hypothetical protein